MHGDVFATGGLDHDLKGVTREIEKFYEFRTQLPGPDKDNLQYVRVLGRVLTGQKKASITKPIQDTRRSSSSWALKGQSGSDSTHQ